MSNTATTLKQIQSNLHSVSKSYAQDITKGRASVRRCRLLLDFGCVRRAGILLKNAERLAVLPEQRI